MLAVIGGTGFGEFIGLESVIAENVETSWGNVVIQGGTLDGEPLIFLPRHGVPATTPPHRINYRANIQALADLGVTRIFAVNAVGSVDPTLAVPELVVPDQLIDYTWGRAHTFFDDVARHIDLTYPYDEALREALLAAARSVQAEDDAVLLRDGGVYGCTQGPRLETAAEIRRMANDGCHIVGMTGMPEVSLARERGIPYAAICIVVNAGAGIDGQIVDLDDIDEVLARGVDWVRRILRRAIGP